VEKTFKKEREAGQEGRSRRVGGERKDGVETEVRGRVKFVLTASNLRYQAQ